MCARIADDRRKVRRKTEGHPIDIDREEREKEIGKCKIVIFFFLSRLFIIRSFSDKISSKKPFVEIIKKIFKKEKKSKLILKEIIMVMIMIMIMIIPI